MNETEWHDGWSESDFPPRMIYQGECGPRWEQFGPANWRISWKGNLKTLEEIAFRRFAPSLKYAVKATAIRVGDKVEVTMCFRYPEP